MPADSAVGIALVLPDLLGTYGDTGNARVLERRLAWRGIPASVVSCTGSDPVPSTCDIYLLGGGEDAAQQLAVRHLRERPGLLRAAAAGRTVFAVCAGLQLLGREFTGVDGRTSSGLDLVDLVTVPLHRRAIGEIVTQPAGPLVSLLTGFENHRGSTVLGPGVPPLARVRRGIGNGTPGREEGVLHGRIVGTYLHGPVLARNPELADLLLSWATGAVLPPLPLEVVNRLRAARLGRHGDRRPGRRWRSWTSTRI